ncbi:MAG TPA: HD domain-containing phosphohydrolase, partial [Solirubrobacteraceae bacterium]|nr:HD domain-containing phosphohydrolase [Solirubrobacteraceae bacterium]
MRVRLAELIAALSLATDLGLGLPQEHALRQTRIALGLCERLGLDTDDRAAVYHVALLAWVGCTADGHELSATFGDDLALRAGSYGVDRAGRPMLGYLLRRVGEGQPPLRRAQMAAGLVADRGRTVVEAMSTHCVVASLFARRLGLGPAVEEPLRHMFARADGRGVPRGVGGEDVPLATRVVQVADVAEVFHRAGGVPPAVAVVRERSGGHLDPHVAAALVDCADELLGSLDETTSWDGVIAAEPGLVRALAGDELEAALEAVADFGDLKSPWFTGHSRGVARLAAGAGEAAGLTPEATTELRRAGLVHDLGRAGVPNTIWDKPGPLTDAERERVRLHPYYTERVLARPAALARLAAIAASHHERLDGSGYH